MNTNDRTPHDRPHGTSHDGVGNDQLLWQLRALRREEMPADDLWPGIAARLSQQAPAEDRNVVPLRRRKLARLAPWALAASLVLAVGVAWQQQPDRIVPPPSVLVDARAPERAPERALIYREADAMAREYDAALRELQAAGGPPAPVGNTLRELDRSAEQIRTALERDPDAHFLLERLRRTYEKRLELTQRAVLS
jgi:hypothetical protein